MFNDNIAAISTAVGTGGVAIVRISGDGALDFKKMFRFSAEPEEIAPNYMYAGKIEGDGFYDYGFFVYFKAPKSFTGEDTVEFHCHGGAKIARGILNKALSLGARAAERGEFTRRAFLNGKLTLSAAEGLAEMINAESLALVRAGGSLYFEKLSQKVRNIQNELKDILAAVAVEIDYPEEDESGADFSEIFRKIAAIEGEIAPLLQSYACGKKIREGVTVAICGAPNVGKSSLLNALLGYDKAIVSSEAGTTRDAVEGQIELGGVIFNLVDTAGIRERAGAIEKIGIERAKQVMQSADVVLCVTDGKQEVATGGATGKKITVFSKCDEVKPFGKYDVAVSSKTGEGLEKLRAYLLGAGGVENAANGAYLLEERHFNALKRAAEALKSACENEGATADLLRVDLNDAWTALGEITGETASEEIVATIFEKFCVGK